MNAIGSAVEWVQNVLLGTIATSVAVVAVAAVGFMMLAGRIEYRRAGRVILGCFILFGARAIAEGIQIGFQGAGPALAISQPALPLPISQAPASQAPASNDSRADPASKVEDYNFGRGEAPTTSPPG